MSAIHIRPGTTDDARSLAPRLRQEDLREASVFGDAEAALVASCTCSDEVFAAEFNGRVIALFGVTWKGGSGIIWMMTSDEASRMGKTLVKVGREVVGAWLSRADMLTNYVHAENRTHIAWLRHLGFSFTGLDVVIKGHPFKHFYMEN